MTLTRLTSYESFRPALVAGLFTLSVLVPVGCANDETEDSGKPALTTTPTGNEAPGGAPGTGSGGEGGTPVASAGGTGGDLQAGAGGTGGGSATGGSATGGSATGGSATGGSATGGAAGNGATGGMASGGMAGSGGAIATGGMGGADPGPQLPKRVLLYHKSPITNVTAQMDLLASKLTEWGFESDRTMDPAMITTDTLKKYGAVGMINPCFDAFGPDGAPQAAALKAFVEAGGGLWGNHCAAVTYNKATPPHPYNQLLGGRGGDGFFDGASTCQKLGDHPTITGLPATFPYSGNIDNTDYLADDITILVRCTWSGGGMKDVAVSWTREPGEGRIFFSNFAKFDVDLADPVLGPEHLYKGLAWVLRR